MTTMSKDVYQKYPDILTKEHVCEITGFGTTKALEIIRELNSDLKGQGYYVMNGKISKSYFFERLRIPTEE